MTDTTTIEIHDAKELIEHYEQEMASAEIEGDVVEESESIETGLA